MNERGKVAGITLGLVFPNNFREVRYLSGTGGVALFNSDESVANVLAPLYRWISSSLNVGDLAAVFGEKIKEWFGNETQTVITPELVWKLWRTGNDDELLPGWIVKKPFCPLEFPLFESPAGVAGRPRITAAMVHTETPDGVRDCYVLEDGSFDGIFWSDMAVEEILAPAYPESGMGICGDSIREMWRRPTSRGYLPTFAVRRPGGLISIPELETVKKSFRRAA